MINNKGFTLVELLAVLVILGVIVAIAIPAVSSTLNRQEEKDLTFKKQQIISSVELKLDKIRNELTNKDDFSYGRCCVTVKWLKNKGFITGKQAEGINEDDGVYRNSANDYILEYTTELNACS